AIRVHDRDDECALLVAGELGRARTAHLEHRVGVLQDPGGDGRAGGRKFGVGNAGLHAGARLDRDLGAEPFHFLDGFRRRGDPVLVRIALARYGNAHSFGSWCQLALPPPAVSASASKDTNTITTLGMRAPLAKP